MSRAQLHRVWSRGRCSIEVWLTPDIVSHPPGGGCDVLINPANQTLVGTRLPYFPRGGPLPEFDVPRMKKVWIPPGYVSSWGGMEAGEGMLYSQQVVDGRVHLLGGQELRSHLEALPLITSTPPVRCPEGSAVLTPAFGELKTYFSHIIHTVAPFHNHPRWQELLRACYIASLEEAKNVNAQSAATPMLGAGAKGASYEAACHVAARALNDWSRGEEMYKGGHGEGGHEEEELRVQMALTTAQDVERFTKDLEKVLDSKT